MMERVPAKWVNRLRGKRLELARRDGPERGGSDGRGRSAGRRREVKPVDDRPGAVGTIHVVEGEAMGCVLPGGNRSGLQETDRAMGMVARDAVLGARGGVAIGVVGGRPNQREGFAGLQHQTNERLASRRMGVQPRAQQRAEQQQSRQERSGQRSAMSWMGAHVAVDAGMGVREGGGAARRGEGRLRNRCRWRSSGWVWRRSRIAAGASRCRNGRGGRTGSCGARSQRPSGCLRQNSVWAGRFQEDPLRG